MMPRWRWLNWLYALLGGYFWLPCSLCSRKYGGHEYRTSDAYLMHDWNSGESVCSNCKEEAERRNEQYMKTHPPPILDWTPPLIAKGHIAMKVKKGTLPEMDWEL